MIRKFEAAFITLLAAASTAFALLIATPVAAKPLSQLALNDRIIELCQASSVDVVGKRMERQCRAELKAKLQEQAARAAEKAKLARK